MRSLTGLLATVLVTALTSPALATPTKATQAVRDKSSAHPKAPTAFANSLAALAANKPAPMPAPQPVAGKPQAGAHHPARNFSLKDVSPYVDFMTVLPGERVPLRAVDAKGEPLDVKWRLHAGTLAAADHFSVWQAPLEPGVHQLTGYALDHNQLVRRNLTMLVTVPTAKVQGGKLNGYPIGTYPRGFVAAATQVANRGARDTYVVPSGFVELTSANVDLPLSQHYTLGDFAGKDDWVKGRKYLFVNERLVEKLERLSSLLRAEGYHAEKLPLLSAYRSPFLNAEIGNETTLSRHTYGDAADMVVTDYNGDGRADKLDADLLMAAVTKLDKETSLTGGASVYRPNGAHGYFIHTDTRGALVRW